MSIPIPKSNYRYRTKVKIILSSKTQNAEDKINDFLKDIDVLCSNIEPLICFSGPSLQVGAMIKYLEEVEDETDAE